MVTTSLRSLDGPGSLSRYQRPDVHGRSRLLPRRPDIVVVSADPEGAAALRTSLKLGGALVGVAPTGPDAAAEIIRLAPDVVVLDVATDDVRAWEIPLALERAGGSDIPVVVVAPRPWGEEVGRCLLAGARTVLLPEDAARPAELITRTARDVPADPVVAAHRLAALRKLAGAGTERSPDAISVPATRLERPPRPTTSRDRLTLLSSAQRRVAEGMVRGRSVSEIAAAAGVSRQAVYGAQRRLARRLGVTVQQLADDLRQRFADVADERTAPEPPGEERTVDGRHEVRVGP